MTAPETTAGTDEAPGVRTLEYAPRPPRWRRRLRRDLMWLGAVALAVAVLCSLPRLLDWSAGRKRLLDAQRRCLTYTHAPTVVYEESPANDPDYNYRGYRTWNRYDGFYPACLSAYESLARLQESGPLGLPVFIHARKAGRGRERLVLVRLSGESAPLVWQVIEPAGRFGGARILNGGTFAPVDEGGRTIVRGYRIGQPDAADPARFTITAVSFAWRTVTIEGRLNDADQVIWRVLP